MEGQNITELAKIIRSKNAGPYRITLDIFFKDRTAYDRARRTGSVSRDAIARAYGIEPDEIVDYVEFDPVYAVKITLKRRTSSGSFEDTDVYGAQQHAPLLSIKVPEGNTTGLPPKTQ
jgi:hypothetical protein